MPIDGVPDLPNALAPDGEGLGLGLNGTINPNALQGQPTGRRASIQPDGRVHIVQYIDSPQPLPLYSSGTFSDLELAANSASSANMTETHFPSSSGQLDSHSHQCHRLCYHNHSRFQSHSPAISEDEYRLAQIHASTRSRSAHMLPATSWSQYASAQSFCQEYMTQDGYSYHPPPWSDGSIPTPSNEPQTPSDSASSSGSVVVEGYDSFARPNTGLMYEDESASHSSISSRDSSVVSTGSLYSFSRGSESPTGHRPGPDRSKQQKRAPRSRQDDSAVGARPNRVRSFPSCWRCRRYKKSCDGPEKCSNCEKGNFRVWPAALGCRRGCLEDLVVDILPPHAAEILASAARITRRLPNWRYGAVDTLQQRMIEEQLPHADRWQHLLLKVQSTGMFGQEFGSLLDILVTYQSSQARPNALLEGVVTLLNANCDIYHNFVHSAWPLPPADITAAVTAAQRAYASVCKAFLTSTLSGRKRDWLPSFLSMCMTFVSIMIMMDAAVAVPQPQSNMLWGSIHNVSRGLRTRLFPTITNLLRASLNGQKPFALSCWSVSSGGTSSSVRRGSFSDDKDFVRSAEGMRMLGNDRAAFDGMRSLQEWIQQNMSLVELGSQLTNSDPFTAPEVPCIAPVFRLFDL